MNTTKGIFSHATDEWETPQDFFDELNRIYHFDLDVCATEQNAKCDRFFNSEQDGLKNSWGGGRRFGAIRLTQTSSSGAGKQQRNSRAEPRPSCLYRHEPTRNGFTNTFGRNRMYQFNSCVEIGRAHV